MCPVGVGWRKYTVVTLLGNVLCKEGHGFQWNKIEEVKEIEGTKHKYAYILNI